MMQKTNTFSHSKWTDSTDAGLFGRTESAVTDFLIWFAEVRAGDEDAFSRLFDFYFRRLAFYLRNHLTTSDRAEGFEDDLANECMVNVWIDLTNGRFVSVTNGDDLWIAIMRVAKSNAIDRMRYLRRKKRILRIDERIGILVEGATVLRTDSVPLEFMEYWERFTKLLENDDLREILRLKIEGNDAINIAVKLGCHKRTIYRKLESIRISWVEFTN